MKMFVRTYSPLSSFGFSDPQPVPLARYRPGYLSDGPLARIHLKNRQQAGQRSARKIAQSVQTHGLGTCMKNAMAGCRSARTTTWGERQ